MFLAKGIEIGPAFEFVGLHGVIGAERHFLECARRSYKCALFIFLFAPKDAECADLAALPPRNIADGFGIRAYLFPQIFPDVGRAVECLRYRGLIDFEMFGDLCDLSFALVHESSSAFFLKYSMKRAKLSRAGGRIFPEGVDLEGQIYCVAQLYDRNRKNFAK